LFRLEQFGFRALWSPYFFIILLLLTLLYFAFLFRHQKRVEEEGLSKRQGVLFVFSVLLLYLIKGSPLDLLGHLMFTFHMVQMALLYLLLPPLFIAAVPDWLWKRIIGLPFVKPAFRLFTKPILALVLFNGLFSFYHVPFIFDFVKTNVFYHELYTAVLFFFAIIMWWPLVNRVEEENELSGLKKIAYLIADSILLTPACALIIFSGKPLYQTYLSGELWVKSLHLCVPADMLASLGPIDPEVFQIMPPLYDQQLGGVIMKVLQEIIYGSVLIYVFREWYRKETEEPDPGL